MAPAKLEADLCECEGVASIFVHVLSSAPHVVCVVVPAMRGVFVTREERKAVEQKIVVQMRRAAIAHNHKPHEMTTRNPLIEWDMDWTVASGLINGSDKLVRARLVEKYGPVLEKQHGTQRPLLFDPDHAETPTSAEEQIIAIVRDILDVDFSADELASRVTFAELGADSMQAMQFLTRYWLGLRSD